MSSVMPLVKINANLRINLFNIARVRSNPGGEVVICSVDGSLDILEGDEATRFLTYFDTFCDDMQSVQQTHTRTAPEISADRDFGELIGAGGDGGNTEETTGGSP